MYNQPGPRRRGQPAASQWFSALVLGVCAGAVSSVLVLVHMATDDCDETKIATIRPRINTCTISTHRQGVLWLLLAQELARAPLLLPRMLARRAACGLCLQGRRPISRGTAGDGGPGDGRADAVRGRGIVRRRRCHGHSRVTQLCGTCVAHQIPLSDSIGDCCTDALIKPIVILLSADVHSQACVHSKVQPAVKDG